MGVFFTIALRNLLQARRRTALLAMALSMVTALLVLLLALSQGLSDTIVRSATALSSGHVNVSGFYKATARDSAPIVNDKASIRRIVEANTPGLADVIDRQRGWAKVISDTGTLYAGLSGIDVSQEERLIETLQLAPVSEYVEGGPEEFEGDPRRLAEPDTAMIFAGQARRLEVRVGDMLTLTTETMDGQSNTGEVRIVAVAKDVGFMSNWSLFTHTETILNLYQLKAETTGAVMLYLDDISKASETMEHLVSVFEAEGYQVMEHQPQPFYMKFETVMGEDWTGQKLDLTIWQDEVSYLTWVVDAIDMISWILVLILLAIIAVGIMNTMWIAVRERTNEVGTLRAIGMSRGRVLLMFLLEALLLGLGSTMIGGTIGALIGVSLDAAQLEVPIEALRAILMSDVLHLVVEPGQVATAILLFTTLTGLSALWPALRASRLQPVTAIHSIG